MIGSGEAQRRVFMAVKNSVLTTLTPNITYDVRTSNEIGKEFFVINALPVSGGLNQAGVVMLNFYTPNIETTKPDGTKERVKPNKNRLNQAEALIMQVFKDWTDGDGFYINLEDADIGQLPEDATNEWYVNARLFYNNQRED